MLLSTTVKTTLKPKDNREAERMERPIRSSQHILNFSTKNTKKEITSIDNESNSL